MQSLQKWHWALRTFSYEGFIVRPAAIYILPLVIWLDVVMIFIIRFVWLSIPQKVTVGGVLDML